MVGHGTSHGHSGAAEKVDEDFPDKQHNKFKIPGLPEPTVATQRRARNREHTLDRIDQVGDNNSNIVYVCRGGTMLCMYVCTVRKYDLTEQLVTCRFSTA